MSYAKVAAAGEEPAKIRFYYGTDDLFNSLSLRTHYRAKMIKDGAGKSQLDDIALSQDEKDIFKELLKDGVNKLGAALFKIAQGVANSIFFDSDLSATLAAKSSGFEILDKEAYNSNLLPVIDSDIRNALRYYCLREWYGVVGSSEDVKTQDILFVGAQEDMINHTFQLRKPTMS